VRRAVHTIVRRLVVHVVLASAIAAELSTLALHGFRGGDSSWSWPPLIAGLAICATLFVYSRAWLLCVLLFNLRFRPASQTHVALSNTRTMFGDPVFELTPQNQTVKCGMTSLKRDAIRLLRSDAVFLLGRGSLLVLVVADRRPIATTLNRYNT
jgi:hypothetical protein